MSAAPDRNAPCPCGSGRKYKACCYPADRARADMIQRAGEAHAAIDVDLSRLVAQVPETGHSVACSAGCNACCTQLIRVTWPEALRIAEWLLLPSQAALLLRFEAQLPAWREQTAKEVAVVEPLLVKHGGAPREGPDRDVFAEAIAAYQRRRVQCPFNDEAGLCAAYPVRPLPCRITFVLDTAEHCGPDATQSMTVLRTQQVQEKIVQLRQGIQEASERGSRRAFERPLPQAVADALTELRRRGAA